MTTLHEQPFLSVYCYARSKKNSPKKDLGRACHTPPLTKWRNKGTGHYSQPPSHPIKKCGI